jgi:hypothetical protein
VNPGLEAEIGDLVMNTHMAELALLWEADDGRQACISPWILLSVVTWM